MGILWNLPAMNFETDPIATLRALAKEQGEVARFEMKGVACTYASYRRGGIKKCSWWKPKAPANWKAL